MSIINGLDNQRGIQTLGTVIANATTLAQHSSDILYHTNGYLYCVVSEDYANATLERRLYMYRSTDGGSNWTKITNLTSGRFDQYPCLIQLDTTDIASDIGIVFVGMTTVQASQGIIRRMAVDVDGTQTLAADALTDNPTTSRPVFVVEATPGYKIFTTSPGFSRSVICYSNTTFNLNNWVSESNINVTNVNQEAILNRVRRLSNGDYIAVFSARSGLNGGVNGLNTLPDNPRTDLVTVVSTDEGVSWGTPQSITAYSGTAGVSADGIDSCLFGDVIERSDGNLAFLFAEGKSQVMIDSDTTPSLSPTGAFIGYRQVLYHPVHDYLLYAHDGTSGGLYVHNLSTNVITRIHSGSTPAIWRNEVVSMDLSADGTYLVLGTATQGLAAADGSLEIFDTTDPDPTLWTVTSLRVSTSPATAFERIGQVQFLSSGYDFVFTYGNGSGTTVGGKVDASNPVSILTLTSPVSSGNQRGLAINEADNRVYGFAGTTIFAINLTTGAAMHTGTVTGFSSGASYPYPLTYRPDTEEIFMFGDSSLYRVVDNGSSFSTVGSALTTTTNPATFSFSVWRPISGENIIAAGGNTVAAGIYCTTEHVWYPGVITTADTNLGWNSTWGQSHYSEVEINGKNWLFSPDLVTLVRVTQNTGRLRVGIFAYNTSTHQVNTASDFYDAVNEVRVGTDWDRLQWPRINVDADDRIHVSATRLNLNRTTQPKKVITGIIESDAQRFTMRATILDLTTRELQMRARIRNTYTNDLDMRARIVFAQCIKMLARIVPRSTYTLDMQATIKNTKSSSMTGTFNVEFTQQVRMEGRFFVATGYNGSQSVQIGASIVKRRMNRMTGHFLVKQTNTPKIASYVVGFNQITVQTLKIGAGIIQQ